MDARVRARDAAGAVTQVDARVLPPWMTPTDRDDARNMLNFLVKRRQTRASGSKPETSADCASET